jgi:hypothetical protein
VAIAFRSTSTGSSANATTSTIALPSGTTTGDVTLLFAQQATSTAQGLNTLPTMTAPSGWTVLVAAAGVIVCWRAYQGGDPATGITFTSNQTNWWESLAVTYSGCDTTAPIDASCTCMVISGTTGTSYNLFRAPSIQPNFNASVLLALYARAQSAGATIALPAGMTARANTAVGPPLRICEKTLTDGTPTGDIDTTCSTTQYPQFGMSIALKTSGASAATPAAPRPTVAGLFNIIQNIATLALPIDHMLVQDSDLLVLLTCGVGSAQTLSGWTQVAALQGANVFTKTWHTGDSGTPTFSITAGITSWVAADLIILRKQGVSTFNVVADTTGTGSGASSATAPSITPATAVDLLLVYFGGHASGAGSWSGVTAGLSDININAVGPSSRLSRLAPSPSPSGAFSATLSTPVDAFSGLFQVAPTVVPHGGPMISIII